LAPGAVLRGFERADKSALLAMLQAVINHAQFRNMITPGGFRMSAAMTNSGALGWISDKSGYRYDGHHHPSPGDHRINLTLRKAA